MFEAAGGVMAERVTDLRDIRDRVIAELRGEEEPGLPQVNGEVVLFADDLSQQILPPWTQTTLLP